MNPFIKTALIVVSIVAALPSTLMAQATQQPSAAQTPTVSACSLLPKEDVKKHLPWIALLDSMPIEEESLGASASACNYPSVYIQVMPFSQSMIDLARKKGGLETISGVGDEAYFHNNADRYAELYVRAGSHLLTLQANVNDSIESVKPGTLNLARALAAKLQ